jgi:hypothetical protein
VGIEGEGPERQVDHQPVQVGGEGAVGSEHEHLASAGGRGEEAGEQADPCAPEHLVRHPGPHPTGDEGGGEQGRAPEGEAEPGPEDPTGDDQGEEHQLDAGRARAQGAQGGADGRQHAEHGDGLGVDAPPGQLGEHDGQHQDEQRPEQQRGQGGIAEPARDDDERPEEGDQPDEGGHQDHGAGAEAHPDGGGGGHRAAPARASVTWSMVR